MAYAQTVDVTQLVNRQKIGRFNISLLAWSFVAVFVDGYDLGALGFAAPEMVRQWHIGRGALGPAFGAGTLGSILGALAFGVLGDLIGRKKTSIAAVLICGIFTLMTVWASGLEQLMWLRFLAGIGFGGIAPNLIALNDEFAPRRMRATMVILMFMGYSFGASSTGLVSVWLVPRFGWRTIFAVGGGAPILVAGCLIFALPESIKFLVVQGRHGTEVAKLARRLSPGLVLGPQTRFVIGDEKQAARISPKRLFQDGRALMTPLLWLAMMGNFVAIFFLNSWLPILLEGGGAAVSQAAIATALFHVGGTVGGIPLSRMMDKYGMSVVAGLCALGVPVIAVLGVSGLPAPLLIAGVFVAGACTVGSSFGLNAMAAMLYPTYLRSNGVGWALTIGRIGSVLGPVIGGMLISEHLSLASLFLAAASPLLLSAGASYGLKQRYLGKLSATGTQGMAGAVQGTVGDPV